MIHKDEFVELRWWKFREAEVDRPGKPIAGVQLEKFFVGGHGMSGIIGL